MNAVILGSKSDIAQGLIPLFRADGWALQEWSRGGEYPNALLWNLVVIALGRVAPVGPWWNQEALHNYNDNVAHPLRLLQEIWDDRRFGASVCFMAGSNPQKIMPGYMAYNASKMALLKVVEQLDFETEDAKFFALGPGYVNTKIHKPTLDARWPNERIAKGSPTPIDKIYDCLKWCITQPKEVVGGRNICVSDPYGLELAERLKNNPNLYKLRRVE